MQLIRSKRNFDKQPHPASFSNTVTYSVISPCDLELYSFQNKQTIGRSHQICSHFDKGLTLEKSTLLSP